MVVDEFDVNGDGKGKKCHQLKKKSQHEFPKKSLLVSEKKHIPTKSEQTIQISM